MRQKLHKCRERDKNNILGIEELTQSSLSFSSMQISESPRSSPFYKVKTVALEGGEVVPEQLVLVFLHVGRGNV